MWRTALAFPNLAVPLSHFAFGRWSSPPCGIVQGRPTNGVGPGGTDRDGRDPRANAAHLYSNVLSPRPASTIGSTLS
jgi:hypothetical protein